MKIFTSYSEGKLHLFFRGELDHHGSAEAMKAIDDAIDSFMPRDCIIDMSDLSFMDSSGIAVILRVYKRLSQSGGRAWIENADGQPYRVIDASGIDRIVKVYMMKEHV